MPPRGGHSQGSSRGSFRSQRQQTSDLVWGSVLALGLPVIAFLVVSALNPGGLDEKLQGGSFGLEEETPPPPMTRELGEAILREVKRLYQDNYLQIFLPRFNREIADFRETYREFTCAKKVIGNCRDTHLKRLKDELAESGAPVEPLRSAIENWDRVTAEAARHLEDNDPRPKDLRGSPGGGIAD